MRPTLPPVRARGSRRPGLLVITAVCLASVLAACSSTSSASDGSSAGGSSADAAQTDATQTRTVQTATGPVDVPAHPQRVVSLHPGTTGSAFDFGVELVGVEDSGEDYVAPRYLDRWKPVPKVTSGGTVDLEAIAALHPDLIIGVDVPYLSQVADKLEGIAPTALAEFGTGIWTDSADQIADFLNAGDRLAEVKQEYADKVEEVKAAHADVFEASTFAIVQGGFDAGNYWIYGSDSPVGVALADLGAHLSSASVTATEEDGLSVSYEEADLLADADYLVYYTNNDGSPANDLSHLLDLEIFSRLPVAQTGLIPTTDFLATSGQDAIGILDAIDAALSAQP